MGLLRLSLISGDRATPASIANIVAFIGPLPGAVVNQVYQLNPGDDVATVTGATGGDVLDDLSFHLSRAKVGCLICPSAITLGVLNASVTQVGTGANFTVALAAGVLGPCASITYKGKITKAGVNGVAVLEYNLDGGTLYPYSLTIPDEGPAVLRGVIDIANGLDLAGLHLDFTAPSADVITFAAGSLAASVAGLKAAVATVAAPVQVLAAGLLTAGKAALLANPRRLVFTTAGVTPANQAASVDIVGFTKGGVAASETLLLAQTATTATSVNAYESITSLDYPTADGTAATIAVGYSSAFADGNEIVAAFDALAVTASLAVRARVAEDSTGSYLELYSTGKGLGVTQTIDDSASTADGPLGFTSGASNLTATGTAATYTIPWTGLVQTFDAGTYALNNTFTFSSTGPTSAIAAIDAAADALRAQFYEEDGSGFAAIVPLVVPATAENAAQLEAELATKLLGWLTDEENTPALVYAAIPTPFHVASATAATNAANINSTDASVLGAWDDASPSHATVVHGDVYRDAYRDGGSGKLRGSYRRPGVLAWSYRRAALPLSADPGEGVEAIPTMSLKHPDGVTFARSENDPRVSARMGGYRGPGFSVLRSTASGKPACDVGVTRAGNGDRFSKIGALAAIYYLLQQMIPSLLRERARRVALQASGAMTADEGEALESRLNAAAAVILRDPEEPHASSVTVVVDKTEVLANTDNLTITYEVQPFGYPETITVIGKLTGVVTEIAA